MKIKISENGHFSQVLTLPRWSLLQVPLYFYNVLKTKFATFWNTIEVMFILKCVNMASNLMRIVEERIAIFFYFQSLLYDILEKNASVWAI